MPSKQILIPSDSDVGTVSVGTASVGVVLLSNSQFRNTRPVALDVLFCEIVEEVSAAPDHFQQPQLAVLVLLVDLEVFCELLYSLREDSNLHLRRTGVCLVRAIAYDHRSFLIFRDHFVHSILSLSRRGACRRPIMSYG